MRTPDRTPPFDTLPTVLRTLLLLLTSCALFAQQFYLKPGDRVVFYGDSITDSRMYTNLVETYVVTRFPDLDVRFTHSGWGGDRVTGGGGGGIDERLKRDVLAYNPSVVTIMLGMNDGRYRAFDQAIFEEYANGYTRIVRMLRDANKDVRITAIQPSPYDDVTAVTDARPVRVPLAQGGYNATLLRYAQFLKDLATREKTDLADLNTNVVAMLEKANAADKENAPRIIPDRVHPLWGGHAVMALELLKAWNAPAIVSDVEIDARANKVAKQDNTAVSNWSTASGYSWTQLDKSLPMPVPAADPATLLAIKSSDYQQRLNQQRLSVKGLAAGKYALSINGMNIGEFSSDQLAAGINLGDMDTPMRKQAEAVHALTLKRTNLHNTRWRTFQVPLAKDDLGNLASAMAATDALVEEVRVRQRAAAKPVAMNYKLTPVR